jgi:N4-(beta-N-acetylglucosaminyl)-L-asparaginase
MATIAIDRKGRMAGGVTTSGTAFKLPGRVGDSAIIGAGIYVDRGVGGAAATGVGEEAMRVCASFLVVEMMGNGREPHQACEQALRRLIAANPELGSKQLALAALRADGAPGGASLRPGFAYAYFDGEENRLVEVEALGA